MFLGKYGTNKEELIGNLLNIVSNTNIKSKIKNRYQNSDDINNVQIFDYSMNIEDNKKRQLKDEKEKRRLLTDVD